MYVIISQGRQTKPTKPLNPPVWEHFLSICQINLTFQGANFKKLSLEIAERHPPPILKKITSSALVTMSIEEKRNLDLKNIDERVEI